MGRQGRNSALALVALTVSAILGAAQIAGAAEFSVEKVNEKSEFMMIGVSGEIKPGDAERFSDIAVKHRNAIVILDSPGGATYDAIEIGRTIKIKGYWTLVLANSSCDSACALIWLAGATRFLEPAAKVGFHATYVDDAEGKRESGVGNALVGNYLSALGLSERAIVFATSAPPTKLNYLTLSNAGTEKISAERFGEEEATSAPTSAVKSTKSQDTTEVATVGDWKILTDSTMGGGCFAFATFNGGYALRFGYDARTGTQSYLLIAGVPWKSIEEAKEYPLQIRLSSNEPWSASMKGVSLSGLKGLIVYFEDKSLAFQTELSAADSASISYGGKEIVKLSLPNAKEAVDALVGCQRSHPVENDPFKR